MNTPRGSHDDLFERLYAYEDRAWRELNDLIKPVIKRELARLRGPENTVYDMEEVVNQAIADIFEARNSYDPSRGELGAFITGVVRNTVRRHHTEAHSVPTVPTDEIVEPDETRRSRTHEHSDAWVDSAEAENDSDSDWLAVFLNPATSPLVTYGFLSYAECFALSVSYDMDSFSVRSARFAEALDEDVLATDVEKRANAVLTRFFLAVCCFTDTRYAPPLEDLRARMDAGFIAPDVHDLAAKYLALAAADRIGMLGVSKATGITKRYQAALGKALLALVLCDETALWAASLLERPEAAGAVLDSARLHQLGQLRDLDRALLQVLEAHAGTQELHAAWIERTTKRGLSAAAIVRSKDLIMRLAHHAQKVLAARVGPNDRRLAELLEPFEHEEPPARDGRCPRCGHDATDPHPGSACLVHIVWSPGPGSRRAVDAVQDTVVRNAWAAPGRKDRARPLLNDLLARTSLARARGLADAAQALAYFCGSLPQPNRTIRELLLAVLDDEGSER